MRTLLALLLLSSSVAHGQAVHSAIRFTTKTANATAACKSATGSCLRVNSDGQLHYSYTAAGVTDFQIGTGGGGGGGGGSGYATVQENGSSLTQRLVLNFSSQFTCVDNAGTLSTDCSLASGAFAASVSNSDSTLTISPTTGAVVASLNTAHANSWSATQTFASPVINGAIGGTSIVPLQRTISQPSDGSDFTVSIGHTMTSTSYSVTCTPSSGSAIPSVMIGTKTTTQFEVITTADMDNGATLDCVVVQR
jgi:hypothetical protein